MDKQRLDEIKEELATLIPEGEAIIFSREGYSVKDVKELQGYKRVWEQSSLARGECQHYHGSGDRCQCGAHPNVMTRA